VIERVIVYNIIIGCRWTSIYWIRWKMKAWIMMRSMKGCWKKSWIIWSLCI